MKDTITESSFINNWPESRKDQFSYDALRAIYQYLTDLEEDCGIELEYDPIAICCEWAEYEDAEEAMAGYNSDNALEGEDALYWLQDHTTVIEFDGGILVQQF